MEKPRQQKMVGNAMPRKRKSRITTLRRTGDHPRRDRRRKRRIFYLRFVDAQIFHRRPKRTRNRHKEEDVQERTTRRFEPDDSDCRVDADFAAVENSGRGIGALAGRRVFELPHSRAKCKAKLRSRRPKRYVALSQSTRDVVPLANSRKEVSNAPNLNLDESTTPIFEDDNGAMELAREPKYRPRTKHIGIKYHHFREHGRRTVNKHIDAKEQIADKDKKSGGRPIWESIWEPVWKPGRDSFEELDGGRSRQKARLLEGTEGCPVGDGGNGDRRPPF